MSSRRAFLLNSAALTIAAAAAIKTRGVAQQAERPNQTPMRTYRIPHTDLTVSRLAYGCSDLGGSNFDQPLGADDRIHAERLIRTAYEHGITLFDHADIYRFGKSEEVFGEVLKASPGFRHKLVLQSKCGQVLPPGWKRGQPTRVDLTREHIVRSAEGSLRRLATDHLDILLLHASSTLVEPEQVANAFDELHHSGKVRYFGVSNHNWTQIQLLKKAVRQPLVVNQVHLALGHADALLDGSEFTVELYQAKGDDRYMGISGAGTFDYCRLQDIQIQAWRPLRALLKPKPDSPPQLKEITQKLTELAEAKHSTPSAVALAWLLHHPAHIVPVIGASTPEHIIDNCAADRVSLSDDEWYDLFVATADIEARALRHSS